MVLSGKGKYNELVIIRPKVKMKSGGLYNFKYRLFEIILSRTTISVHYDILNK